MAVVSAACGTDHNAVAARSPIPDRLPPGDSCVPGTLTGAGSTFVQTIVEEWIAAYERTCPKSTVGFQGVGSGAGIQQLTSGTVGFAASDVLLTPSEHQALVAKGGPVLQIPWAAGGVALEYHLTGVRNLRLSPATLAGIFAGKITRWNDPRLRADNPGTRLPAEGIQVFHRSDGSGTTAAFTSYLKAAAPAVWTAGAGKVVSWPTGVGAKGSDQVTAAVVQSEGSIGYSEVSYAKATGLAVALIENPSGRYLGPSGEAVTAALASAKVPSDLQVQIDYTPLSPAAYPISTVTYAIAHSSMAPTEAALFRSFLRFALGPGQAAVGPLFYAPLPSSLLAKDLAAAASIRAS